MRRFDETATLDKLAERGALPLDAMRDLARAVHAMHAQARVGETEPALAAMARWIAQNAEAFAATPDLFPAGEAADLAEASRAAFAHAAPTLRERGARGFVRRCHGDLHLGNLAMIDGGATPFDAIEFDDAIATGDILYDLAFAVMDLWERGLRTHANRLLNAYLAESEDENGAALALLPLFLSLRAAIRAKVEANGAAHKSGPRAEKARDAARRYFDFARAFLKPAPARLVAVGGLSGAGKSAVAAALAPEIGAAPGAVWLRSDVERKHMFGVDERARLPGEAYGAQQTTEVYARLERKARAALGAGASVLIDAVHARAAERARGAEIAAQLHAPFVGLWLEAPLETRLQRVGARRGDASDADAAVVEAQQAEPLAERGWRVVDASGDLATTLGNARIASGLGEGV